MGKKYSDFEDVMQHHAGVHLSMVKYMNGDINYIETLKNIIVDLANENAHNIEIAESLYDNSPSPVAGEKK